jgi:4-hydroxybenzoate polyprenyltransferase
MINLRHYFRWLRVIECLIMLGFPLAGAVFAAREISFSVVSRTLTFVAAILLHFLAVYSFNSYCGFADDINNKRLAYVRESPKAGFLVFTLLFLCLAFLLYSILNPWLMLMAAVSFVLWILYSMPRYGLKNFPVTGTLLHFVSQILHFQMGYLVLAPISTYSLVVSIYFALIFAGGHIHHELIDYEADKRAGIKTGAVFFGQKGYLVLYYIVFLSSGMYWVSLYAFGLVETWELIPFLGAFLLQSSAVLYFRLAHGKQFDFFLANRALHRIFYFLAGMIYVILKFAV